jgi:hypothetical protein
MSGTPEAPQRRKKNQPAEKALITIPLSEPAEKVLNGCILLAKILPVAAAFLYCNAISWISLANEAARLNDPTLYCPRWVVCGVDAVAIAFLVHKSLNRPAKQEIVEKEIILRGYFLNHALDLADAPTAQDSATPLQEGTILEKTFTTFRSDTSDQEVQIKIIVGIDREQNDRASISIRTTIFDSEKQEPRMQVKTSNWVPGSNEELVSRHPHFDFSPDGHHLYSITYGKTGRRTQTLLAEFVPHLLPSTLNEEEGQTTSPALS